MEKKKLNNIHKFEKQIISLPKNVQWCQNVQYQIKDQFNLILMVLLACLNKDYKTRLGQKKKNY